MYSKNSTLTVTSGVSALSGAKTDVVALFADIRGFSNWCNTQPLEHVADLMKIQFERVIQICNDHHHSFHKFLGDGFLLMVEQSFYAKTSADYMNATGANKDPALLKHMRRTTERSNANVNALIASRCIKSDDARLRN